MRRWLFRAFSWIMVVGFTAACRPPVATESKRVRTDAQGKTLVYEDHFDQGAANWQPTDASAWKIIEQDENKVYALHRQSSYQPPHRSPHNIALLKNVSASNFDLRARVRSTTRDYGHRSMCLFFGYQDPAHFYYVHFGQEGDDHSNQIFIVNDAARTKITTRTTKGTPWDHNWHDVRIVRDVTSGHIEVYFDDMDNPVMTANDKTFTQGQVGLGSFDDTGNWDDVRLFVITGDQKSDSNSSN